MDDVEVARRLNKKHGTSYYFATCLFPGHLREATFALYAFFRVPDEFVDNGAPEQAQQLLENWRSDWQKAYQLRDSSDPVLRLNAQVFHRYQIPYDYSETFLAAMFRDLSDTRYASYAELESYMYGSAAVVGLMMSHVIGFADPVALEYAQKLGYAMQLTNFLRDIDEDFQQRGRIYLPLDELQRFGVKEAQFAERHFDANFYSLMQFQMQRAHKLYEDAEPGIALLNSEGRRAVRVASALYRAILTKLEQQGSNPFAGRARTNTLEKVQRTMSVWND
ncbi:MAG: phytoene/squalene synthase family protein [Armatimonadetes bacterium]|nr:phytoene/squalene synthase family protein [Armatimonadota bacterium]